MKLIKVCTIISASLSIQPVRSIEEGIVWRSICGGRRDPLLTLLVIWTFSD